MEKTELLDQVADDIFSYVMQGDFPQQSIASSLKPKDLNDRFEEYEKLMDFHFVLRNEIVELVNNLNSELRSIKTETEKESRISNGNVDGRIDWSSTVKERYSRNPDNSALFVVDNSTQDYSIDENIVLKKLLSIIYNTLDDCEEFFDRNHEWSKRWTEKHGDLVQEMKNTFERNVHIERIRDPEEYEPTERMLNSAENSRNKLYRDAAKYLRMREKIFSGDQEEIRDLLEKTAITPDDEDRIMELFVLFKFISSIESIEAGSDFNLNTISRGTQRIASMQAEDKEIRIYHDSSAKKDLDIEFKYDPEAHIREEDGEPVRELTRPEKVEKEAQDTIGRYFGKNTSKHTGRPDVILVEIIKDNEEREYFITEVKNSTNENTIRRGIKEALEYLAFLRDLDEERFVYSDEDPFGGDKAGLLVVQDFEDDKNTQDYKKQKGPIRIVEASKLEKNIEDIIADKINR
ncbi:hypothetical protein HRED_00840 [Candidatus Haloredivivus sp. G17]|nr:hypothetical protein HRED_00840 [Candidatus Haloredivivus sp. G17]